MNNENNIRKNYLENFLSHSGSELYHYGIKGQKWGIRNYQNSDGTLTEAGKARYNDSGTYKDPEKMSTDDLIKSSNRLNAEYNYKRLQDVSTPEKRSQQKKAAIRKAALSSLISTGATFAATYGISALYNKVKDKKVRAGEMAANAAIASLVVGAGTLPNLFNAVNIPNVQVQSQIDKSKNNNKDKDSAKHSDEFSDELYHYGIKGQKWGIRKYQNPDGSLTAEGKARYQTDEFGNMSKEGKQLYNQDNNSAVKNLWQNKSNKDKGKAIGAGIGALVGVGAGAALAILKAKGKLPVPPPKDKKSKQGLGFVANFLRKSPAGMFTSSTLIGTTAGYGIGRIIGKQKDKNRRAAFANAKKTERQNRKAD